MPFQISQTFVSTRKITRFEKSDIVARLQDHEFMLRLSPNFVRFEELPSGSEPNIFKYRVTDKIQAIFGLHFSTNFEATFCNTKNGVDVDVQAGFGTKLKSHYIVRSDPANGLELREETEVCVRCHYLLFRGPSLRK